MSPKTLLVLLVAAFACNSNSASVTGVSKGTGPWPNEPAAFTQVDDQAWSAFGSWSSADPGGSGWPVIVANQDGTLSPPGALEFKYPSGMGGGGSDPGSPGHTWFDLPANRIAKEIYVGIGFKVSSNFSGHPSTVNKIFFLDAHNSGANDLWVEIGGVLTGPLNVQVVTEFSGCSSTLAKPDSTNGLPDPHSGEVTTTISRNAWHKYEVYARLPTVSGGNGTLKIWVDGALNLNRTDMCMTFAGNGWDQVHFDPIWGGVGGTKPQTDDLWIDHTYVGAP